MNTIAIDKLNKMKEYLIESLEELYKCSKESALEMLEKTRFLEDLDNEDYDYITHKSYGYWAEHIYKRYNNMKKRNVAITYFVEEDNREQNQLFLTQ